MVSNRWIGKAQPKVAQDVFRVQNVKAGTVWRLRVGSLVYSYTYPASVVGDVISSLSRAQDVVDNLLSLQGGSLFTNNGNNGVSLIAILDDDTWAIQATGDSTGSPLDVSLTVEDPASATIRATELQKGSAGRNQIQSITFPKTPTAGTWDLQVGSEVTNLAYNASASAVQTAMLALDQFTSGDVAVSGSVADGFQIEFQSTKAATNLLRLAAKSDDFVGVADVLTTKTVYGGRSSKTYSIGPTVFAGNAATQYRFFIGNNYSHYITGASSEDEIESALRSITDLEAASVSVGKDDTNNYTLSIYSSDTFGELEMEGAELTLTNSDQSEKLTELVVKIINSPDRSVDGQIQFTYQGVTKTVDYAVGGLPPSAAEISAEIQTFADAFWQCTSAEYVDSVYTMTLQLSAPSDGGILDVSLVDVIGTDAIDCQIVQFAIVARNEIQQLVLESAPTGGTFTLTSGANTTSALAYNASAATIQTALTGLASIGGGNATVSGNNGGPWTIKYGSGKALTDMPTLVGDGSSLTIPSVAAVDSETVQTPTGPNWWTDKDNWSQNRVPTTGDTAVFENSDIDCIYGIEGVGAFDGLDVYRSYTGSIGLSALDDDGTPRTIPTFLVLSSSSGFFPARIGIGSESTGIGPELVKLDTIVQPADIKVLSSTTPQADSVSRTVVLAGLIRSLQITDASVQIGEGADHTAIVDDVSIQPSSGNAVEPELDWTEFATIKNIESVSSNVSGDSVPWYASINGGSGRIGGVGNCGGLTIQDAVLNYEAKGFVGRQGVIDSLGVDGARLEITDVDHGLVTGDRVYVARLGRFSISDGFYSVERSDDDTFVLIATTAALPYGVAGAVSGINTYYEPDSAQWGLADSVVMGVDGVLDFGSVEETRSIVSPVRLQSVTARVLDPLKTVPHLLLLNSPGWLESEFGSRAIVYRGASLSTTGGVVESGSNDPGTGGNGGGPDPNITSV